MAATVSTIPGGVTTPRGFRAAGVRAGIKANRGLDLALLVSDGPAQAAAVFTTNLALAAPVVVSREHLARSGGTARAVIVKIRDGLPAAFGALGADQGAMAARAIMTTDPFPKEAAAQVVIDGRDVTIGGMAKGSGMIEPMLATMLAFVTTDAAVPKTLLDRALREAVGDTFNAITVDGECSTNDCVMLLANGASGVAIDESSYEAFSDALRSVCLRLALGIVRG